MILFNARLLELLNQPSLSHFHCVRIGDMLMTSYYRNLELADGLYLTSNILVEISPPQLSSVVDRDLYSIRITDSDFELSGAFETSIIGAPLSVYLGFVDYNTGVPETGSLLTVYNGIVESYSSEIDPKTEGSVITTVSAANFFASLDDVGAYYTSANYVNELLPGDTSYDQINDGSSKVNLNWGRS